MKDYPNLQIYFPSSLNNQIYKNVIDYLDIFIKINKEKKNNSNSSIFNMDG